METLSLAKSLAVTLELLLGKYTFVNIDAFLHTHHKLALFVVLNKSFYFFILHSSDAFDVVSLCINVFKILFEGKHALLERNVAAFHMVGFFDKMDERLRLYKSMPEFLVVAHARVSVEVKDLMRGCILQRFWIFVSLGNWLLGRAVLALRAEKFFKIIYHVNHKV